MLASIGEDGKEQNLIYQYLVRVYLHKATHEYLLIYYLYSIPMKKGSYVYKIDWHHLQKGESQKD